MFRTAVDPEWPEVGFAVEGTDSLFRVPVVGDPALSGAPLQRDADQSVGRPRCVRTDSVQLNPGLGQYQQVDGGPGGSIGRGEVFHRDSNLAAGTSCEFKQLDVPGAYLRRATLGQ